MGDPVTFLTVKPRKTSYRSIEERVKDYQDVAVLREEAATREQASRCLGCFLPFCHWSCPLGNHVGEWNARLAEGKWEDALRLLHATNNMPEITGRICPAPCETGCVLNLQQEPVTNRENELAIVEHGFQAGLIRPRPPARRTGKRVAVVGSGPAGLCCADQLNQAGHSVTVFERDELPGGLLRYGIPDFKLEKRIIDRRLELWKAEGVEFLTGVTVGEDMTAGELRAAFDAVCLTGGSRVPRDLPVEGRQLRGIHFAMEYLAESNRRVGDPARSVGSHLDAKGKQVVVIGGGDTGADCVGTAHRQGAKQVVQIELLPKPPASRGPRDLWPDTPLVLRSSTSHEEGGAREWSVLTKRFLGERGAVKKLSCVRVEFTSPQEPGGRPVMRELPGTEFELRADFVLLAMGFTAPGSEMLLNGLGVGRDPRGHVATSDRFLTAAPGVFAAGDMRRGQSLVVWAMAEGRQAARAIDEFLMGRSDLPLT